MTVTMGTSSALKEEKQEDEKENVKKKKKKVHWTNSGKFISGIIKSV
jgi:hypothetical protein